MNSVKIDYALQSQSHLKERIEMVKNVTSPKKESPKISTAAEWKAKTSKEKTKVTTLPSDAVKEMMNKHQSGIYESMKRFNEIVSEMSWSMEAVLADFRRTVLLFIFQALESISHLAPVFASVFKKYQTFVKSVNETGWLPYYSVPFHYVEECDGNIDLLENSLSNYYTTHWDEIRRDIESRLRSYHVSEETKETFREALSVHEGKNYRCVSAPLFSAIEKEFYFLTGKNPSKILSVPFDTLQNLTSHEIIKELTGHWPQGDSGSIQAYFWVLLDRLVNHVYKTVKYENRKEYEQDFTPNRHAVAHGLVSYSKHKHSMNMIIMADFIFQILPPKKLFHEKTISKN